MIKKILLGLLGLVLLAFAYIYFQFLGFRSDVAAQLDAGSQVVATARGPIEVVRKGSSGPLVVFLHGTPGGYDQAPAEASYRMIAPSRPGYLRTPLSVGASPAAQAEAVLALLDALGETEKVFIMGASGGGPAAYSFAAAYPERTHALIAIEALSFAVPEEGIPAMFQNDFVAWAGMSALLMQGVEGVVKALIPAPENQQRVMADESRQQQILAMAWSIWPPSLRQAGTDNDFAQFAVMDLPLAEISVPTLAVHGSEDISVPIEHAEYAADLIPDFTLHVIEGADHMMPVTHDEEMGAAIETFVQERLLAADDT